MAAIFNKISVSILLLCSICMPLSSANSNNRPYSVDSDDGSCIRQRDLEARNKQVVLNFIQQLFGDKNIASVDNYVAPGYIQHNPTVADGRDALKTAAAGWFADDQTPTKVDIKRASAEGNLVWVHYRKVYGDEVTAFVDIFRVEDGMIQEHWDVIQTLADPAKSANSHPLFR